MPDAPKRDSRTREGEIEPWALAGLGVQFAVALVAGVFAGQWIDRRFNSDPFGMIVGAFLLGGGVFVGSYRRLMAKSRRDSSGASGASDDIGKGK
jgi:F0F1-type ATP synthase assembly protein I